MTQKITSKLALLTFMTALTACSSQKKEKECVDPPPAANKSVQPRLKKPDTNWCRSCVMGPKGWASCQTVYAEKDDENESSIKTRSLEKACLDSGFERGNCPDKAVISTTCKGDPPPKRSDSSAKALHKAFFGNKAKPLKEKKGKNEKKVIVY